MIKYYLNVLQNYATFSGRARRAEYWYFGLLSTIISIILTVIELTVGISFISTVYSVAILVPSIAVGVRRMHDVGKSGWFLLIPFYNLILLFSAGDEGTNEYGPDPKNPESGGGFANDTLDGHLIQ
ncbi:MAG: putative cytochrome [Bacteroidota bacterium]|jgi:uncharacterized membrane protein YhaH (DUF805 family)